MWPWADDVSLEVISGWGGPVNTVDIEGKLAYIGSGRQLVNVDVSDPTKPLVGV